jgi:hypothetical protein
MLTIHSNVLKNWVPYKLFVNQGIPHCQWLYTGDQPYDDPFFDDTIGRCKSLSFNSQRYKVVSTVDVLPQWAAQVPAASPAAFIFHVSRCGSTLIAQLFGLQPQHIVLAEVPFFDQLLRLPYQQPATDTDLLQQALMASLQLYGHQRTGLETHLFLKTDSWHLCFYQQLRQLYPTVPFILLYRSPDEVMRSQRKERGKQAVQGVLEPAIFGFDASIIHRYSFDEYMAKVLECYFTHMQAIATTDSNTLLVNYNEPLMEMMERVAAFAGVVVSEEEKAAMQQRSHFHAKHPGQVFNEPKVAEQLPVYLLPVMELYEQLELKRVSG